MQEKKGWCEMKAVSREQAVAVMAVLMSNVDWDELDGKALQDEVIADPKGSGRRFTQFLKNGAKTATVTSFPLKLAPSFNLAKFIGEDWSVWKGPANGNGLEGEEDRDVREDSLTAIDFEKLILETNLQTGEISISGEEKLRRLKEGKNIRLGARAFLALWNDYQAHKAEGKPQESVLEKLRRSKNMTCIHFFGTILRGLDGTRRVLYLYFDGRERDWCYDWLGNHWSAGCPSALLASVN
ncbi:MAG: hypothetical protein PHI53_01325 [Candidatus Pacebacteria bacterium]|nr:hypothetical protein [Candidatus Paceibacterota bacterium]